MTTVACCVLFSFQFCDVIVSWILVMNMKWFSQIWKLKSMEVEKKATFYIFGYQL
jgi:hypothetical protein